MKQLDRRGTAVNGARNACADFARGGGKQRSNALASLHGRDDGFQLGERGLDALGRRSGFFWHGGRELGGQARAWQAQNRLLTIEATPTDRLRSNLTTHGTSSWTKGP